MKIEHELIGVTLPVKTLEMLAEASMLDLHDDNGPGHVECPICAQTIAMLWKQGQRFDDPDDIAHLEYCPIRQSRLLLGYEI